MTEIEENIFRDGASAFNDGLDEDECPYQPSTNEFNWWITGWDLTRQLAIMVGDEDTLKEID